MDGFGVPGCFGRSELLAVLIGFGSVVGALVWVYWLVFYLVFGLFGLCWWWL